MEKLKQYKIIIILILVILGMAFYWFEWRPYNITQKCRALTDRVLTLKSLLERDSYQKYETLPEKDKQEVVEYIIKNLPKGIFYDDKNYQKIFDNCLDANLR